MNRTYFRAITASRAVMSLAVSVAVTGCVSTTPNLDRHFGEAVSFLKAQQTLYPAASGNTDPVNGMDGKAAKSAYDEYQKSYRAPVPQPNVFSISIGGSR
jgi:hypothetical protein